MIVYNPSTFDHIISVDGSIIKCKKIEITNWDMDANLTHQEIHGLDQTKVIMFQVIINNDSGAPNHQTWLQWGDIANNFSDGMAWIDTLFVQMNRRAGGFFDNPNYNSTGHRGWVFIWYDAT